MDASKAAQIKSHAREIAKLLYEETESTSPEQLENFAGIEQAVRSHLLERVGPEIGEFFVKQQASAGEGENEPSKASLATSKSPKSKGER